jgi:hypothetical protein
MLCMWEIMPLFLKRANAMTLLYSVFIFLLLTMAFLLLAMP